MEIINDTNLCITPEQDYFKNRFIGAIGRNDIRAVVNFYKKCPSIVHYRSITMETPLFKAIICKRMNIIKFLIKVGIDMEATNINNDTALFFILHLRKHIPYEILRIVLIHSKVDCINASYNPIPTINTSANIFHLLAKKQTCRNQCDWDFHEIMKIICTKKMGGNTKNPYINELNGIDLTPILTLLIYNPFNTILLDEFLKHGADIWKDCSGAHILLSSNYILGKNEYYRIKKEEINNCLNIIRRQTYSPKPAITQIEYKLPSEINRCIRNYLNPLEKLLTGAPFWNKLTDDLWNNILDFAY